MGSENLRADLDGQRTSGPPRSRAQHGNSRSPRPSPEATVGIDAKGAKNRSDPGESLRTCTNTTQLHRATRAATGRVLAIPGGSVVRLRIQVNAPISSRVGHSLNDGFGTVTRRGPRGSDPRTSRVKVRLARQVRAVFEAQLDARCDSMQDPRRRTPPGTPTERTCGAHSRLYAVSAGRLGPAAPAPSSFPDRRTRAKGEPERDVRRLCGAPPAPRGTSIARVT
jgi:hypothetical protein